MPLVDPEMKKKFCWPCIIGGLIGVGMTPMLCFGIVCLSKGDEDMSCGPGGTVRPRARAHPRAPTHPAESRRARRPAGRRHQHDGHVGLHHRLPDGAPARAPRPARPLADAPRPLRAQGILTNNCKLEQF